MLLPILIILIFFLLNFAVVTAQTTGLVAYWKFNESSGTTAADSSGSGLSGTVTGATWTTGKSGNALTFDGINDNVVVTDDDKLTLGNSYTIELWFNPSQSHQFSSSQQDCPIDNSCKWLIIQNGAYGIVLHRDGYLKFYSGTNPYQSSTKNTWSANTWYHVAAVCENGNTWKIYLDGSLDSSGSTSCSTANWANPLGIGYYTGSFAYFGGLIDEVKLYNRALTSAEILAEYQGTPLSTTTSTTTTIPVNQTTTTTTTTIPVNQTTTVPQTTTTTIPLTTTTTTIPVNQTNQTTTTTVPTTTTTTISPNQTNQTTTTTTTVPVPQNLSCTLDSACAEKITCSQVIGNDTPRCVASVCQCGAKLVDKTVLVEILINMELLKTSFVSLNNSATSLLSYYISVNDTNNTGKWADVVRHFGYGLANITQTENYINLVKAAPTQLDIIEIKNRIGTILLVVDAIVRVILSG